MWLAYFECLQVRLLYTFCCCCSTEFQLPLCVALVIKGVGGGGGGSLNYKMRVVHDGIL